MGDETQQTEAILLGTYIKVQMSKIIIASQIDSRLRINRNQYYPCFLNAISWHGS
jgi:hypothetical protein